MNDWGQKEKQFNEMDPDQLREIYAGEKAGIDTTLYARKEYLAIQMEQIRRGLEEGLDVTLYAKPEYDWFQMEEIRKGLKRGLDVSKYTDPSIPYEKMRQIRKGLVQGIDLSRFVKLHAKVLRQLRKAFVSKVNIVEFVKKGYEAPQLDRIRAALEKGLDIEPYLVKEFRGVAIHEICKGLEEGLDVARYAKIEYSWQQMREIRLGMEGRLDTSLYEDSLYSWSQMQEIRLGLEAGLDVSEYCSLMYTATDMKRFRMKLLEEMCREIVSSSRNTYCLDDFLISVSSDEMEAYIEVRAAVDKSFTREELEQALEQEGVCEGILYDELDRILEEKCYNRGILVAKGRPAQKGIDGRYEYFFDQTQSGKPKLCEDGSVDYQSIQWFVMVEEGDRLAYYHPATEGTAGVTVRGNILRAMRGKEKKILNGRGIRLSLDKRTYVAAIGGKVELDEQRGRLDISRVCIVDEVTLATGNIDFDGCVYIKGNVGRGTTVKATEDIVIDGAVEASHIRCGGSLLLRQGANGLGGGRIKAGKNVEGKFFEEVKVKAGKDIRANSCLNCDLSAGSNIIISGTKGILAGGMAQAVKGVQSYQIGNRAQIGTVIRLGISEQILKEKNNVEKKIKSVRNELTILGNALVKFQRMYPPDVRETIDMYIKIEDAIYTKELEQEKLYKRQMNIEENIQTMTGAKAVVRGVLHEGSIIEIDRLRWIAPTARNITVKRVANRIAVYSN